MKPIPASNLRTLPNPLPPLRNSSRPPPPRSAPGPPSPSSQPTRSQAPVPEADDVQPVYERILDVLFQPSQQFSYSEVPEISELFTFAEIRSLIVEVRSLLAEEPSLIYVPAPCRAVSDIHGQLPDLLRIFGWAGPPDGSIPWVFLGDYVDRTDYSTEVILLLYALKFKWPTKIILLRGNHETPLINNAYGFHNELTAKFGDAEGHALYNAFNDSFDFLPLAAMAVPPGYEGEPEPYEQPPQPLQPLPTTAWWAAPPTRGLFEARPPMPCRYLLVHGGIGRLECLQDIIDVVRPVRMTDGDGITPTPGQAVLQEVVWSDPVKDESCMGLQRSARDGYSGGIVSFGADRVHDFCERNHVTAILRGHELVHEGLETAFGGRVVTFFSAVNYNGSQINHGCILHLELCKDADGLPSILLHPIRIEARPLHLLGRATQLSSPRQQPVEDDGDLTDAEPDVEPTRDEDMPLRSFGPRLPPRPRRPVFNPLRRSSPVSSDPLGLGYGAGDDDDECPLSCPEQIDDEEDEETPEWARDDDVAPLPDKPPSPRMHPKLQFKQAQHEYRDQEHAQHETQQLAPPPPQHAQSAPAEQQQEPQQPPSQQHEGPGPAGSCQGPAQVLVLDSEDYRSAMVQEVQQRFLLMRQRTQAVVEDLQQTAQRLPQQPPMERACQGLPSSGASSGTAADVEAPREPPSYADVMGPASPRMSYADALRAPPPQAARAGQQPAHQVPPLNLQRLGPLPQHKPASAAQSSPQQPQPTEAEEEEEEELGAVTQAVRYSVDVTTAALTLLHLSPSCAGQLQQTWTDLSLEDAPQPRPQPQHAATVPPLPLPVPVLAPLPVPVPVPGRDRAVVAASMAARRTSWGSGGGGGSDGGGGGSDSTGGGEALQAQLLEMLEQRKQEILRNAAAGHPAPPPANPSGSSSSSTSRPGTPPCGEERLPSGASGSSGGGASSETFVRPQPPLLEHQHSAPSPCSHALESGGFGSPVASPSPAAKSPMGSPQASLRGQAELSGPEDADEGTGGGEAADPTWLARAMAVAELEGRFEAAVEAEAAEKAADELSAMRV
ncbi:hypothetical protein HYH03_001427 [Edaphochlamys debaryana]|uniref:Serine/threonine-protein phosphatase n=1 Tax=Edaphochlamys debaryana TaxID=47281 RepID=A0A835YGS4_9CHLO|nr:hypothetical protein HYH03_001427 [Edaphochlamys debaryana]|eukprot:KAG2500661.1 hypothetical protein HYH03_001427 [Edaphochlamys debaryana]